MAKPKFSWLIPAVAIVSLLFFFIWRMGVFNMGAATATYTGFAKIKPQLAGTGFDGSGQFIGTFTNGAGATIYVKNVEVRGTLGGSEKVCISSNIKPSTVSAGGNFQVKAYGCQQGYAGDVYNARVNIDYEVTIGGVKTSLRESGVLRGLYEGGSYKSSGLMESGRTYSGGYYSSRLRRRGPHKSFDFGWWWWIIVLLSIAYILEVYNAVNKVTSSTKIQAISVYGFIFLLCSTFIFIFGVDHYFNTQEIADVIARLRYGWLIESVIYFFIACVLIGVAEYLMRAVDRSKTVVSSILKPIITLLLLTLIFIHPYRAVTSTLDLSPEMKLSEFKWILEILVLSACAVFYHIVGSVASKDTGLMKYSEALYYTKSVGFIYSIAAAGFFIWGVNTLIYSTDTFDFRGIFISAFLGIAGVVLFLINREKMKVSKVKVTEKTRESEDHVAAEDPFDAKEDWVPYAIILGAVFIFLLYRSVWAFAVMGAVAGFVWYTITNDRKATELKKTVYFVVTVGLFIWFADTTRYYRGDPWLPLLIGLAAGYVGHKRLVSHRRQE